MANNKSAASRPSNTGVQAAGDVAAALAAVPAAAQAEITRQAEERAEREQKIAESPAKTGTLVLRAETHVMRDGVLTILPAGTPASELTKAEREHHAVKAAIGQAGINAPGERAQTVDDLEGMTDEVAHLSFEEQTGTRSRVTPNMTPEAQRAVGTQTAIETGLPAHNVAGLTEASLRDLPAAQREALESSATADAKAARKAR